MFVLFVLFNIPGSILAGTTGDVAIISSGHASSSYSAQKAFDQAVGFEHWLSSCIDCPPQTAFIGVNMTILSTVAPENGSASINATGVNNSSEQAVVAMKNSSSIQCVKLYQTLGHSISTVLLQKYSSIEDQFITEQEFHWLSGGVWLTLDQAWQNPVAHSMWRVRGGWLAGIYNLSFFSSAECLGESWPGFPISSVGDGITALSKIGFYPKRESAIGNQESWVGIYRPGLPVDDVKCVMFSEDPQFLYRSPKILTLESNANGGFFGNVSSASELVFSWSYGYHPSMLLQQFPVEIKTEWSTKHLWRIRPEVDALYGSAFAVSDLMFYSDDSCSAQILDSSRVLISSGDSLSSKLAYAYNGNHTTSWSHAQSGVTPSSTWIGFHSQSVVEVQCVLLHMPEDRFSRSVVLEHSNGRLNGWTVSKVFDDLTGGVTLRLPVNREMPEYARYRIVNSLPTERQVNIQDVSLYFHRDCQGPKLFGGPFSDQGIPVHAFDNDPDTAWASDCVACRPYEAWIGVLLNTQALVKCVEMHGILPNLAKNLTVELYNVSQARYVPQLTTNFRICTHDKCGMFYNDIINHPDSFYYNWIMYVSDKAPWLAFCVIFVMLVVRKIVLEHVYSIKTLVGLERGRVSMCFVSFAAILYSVWVSSYVLAAIFPFILTVLPLCCTLRLGISHIKAVNDPSTILGDIWIVPITAFRFVGDVLSFLCDVSLVYFSARSYVDGDFSVGSFPAPVSYLVQVPWSFLYPVSDDFLCVSTHMHVAVGACAVCLLLFTFCVVFDLFGAAGCMRQAALQQQHVLLYFLVGVSEAWAVFCLQLGVTFSGLCFWRALANFDAGLCGPDTLSYIYAIVLLFTALPIVVSVAFGGLLVVWTSRTNLTFHTILKKHVNDMSWAEYFRGNLILFKRSFTLQKLVSTGSPARAMVWSGFAFLPSTCGQWVAWWNDRIYRIQARADSYQNVFYLLSAPVDAVRHSTSLLLSIGFMFLPAGAVLGKLAEHLGRTSFSVTLPEPPHMNTPDQVQWLASYVSFSRHMSLVRLLQRALCVVRLLAVYSFALAPFAAHFALVVVFLSCLVFVSTSVMRHYTSSVTEVSLSKQILDVENRHLYTVEGLRREERVQLLVSQKLLEEKRAREIHIIDLQQPVQETTSEPGDVSVSADYDSSRSKSSSKRSSSLPGHDVLCVASALNTDVDPAESDDDDDPPASPHRPRGFPLLLLEKQSFSPGIRRPIRRSARQVRGRSPRRWRRGGVPPNSWRGANWSDSTPGEQQQIELNNNNLDVDVVSGNSENNKYNNIDGVSADSTPGELQQQVELNNNNLDVDVVSGNSENNNYYNNIDGVSVSTDVLTSIGTAEDCHDTAAAARNTVRHAISCALVDIRRETDLKQAADHDDADDTDHNNSFQHQHQQADHKNVVNMIMIPHSGPNNVDSQSSSSIQEECTADQERRVSSFAHRTESNDNSSSSSRSSRRRSDSAIGSSWPSSSTPSSSSASGAWGAAASYYENNNQLCQRCGMPSNMQHECLPSIIVNTPHFQRYLDILLDRRRSQSASPSSSTTRSMRTRTLNSHPFRPD